MKHPDQGRLLEFLNRSASEADAEVLFAHLGACHPCADRLKALRAIAADFDGCWEAFLEEVRLRSDARQPVAEPRVVWDVVVDGILDGVRRLATLAATSVTAAAQVLRPEPVLVPVYVGVGDPERAGVAALANSASELCRAHREDQALDILQDIQRSFPAAAAATTLELRVGESILGRVAVDARRPVVAAIVDRATVGGLQVWAELETGGTMRRARLERVEAARYLLAEFDRVPGVSFRIRVRLESLGDLSLGSGDLQPGDVEP